MSPVLTLLKSDTRTVSERLTAYLQDAAEIVQMLNEARADGGEVA